MKSPIIVIALVMTGLFAAGLNLRSQNATAAPAATTFETLTQIKLANEKMITRQQATLEQLKNLSAEAKQIKSFGKRG